LDILIVTTVPKLASKKLAPEYYVLLCAGRYAANVKRLMAAGSDDERERLQQSLTYLFESGLIEARQEYERRTRKYPPDFQKAFIKKDGSVVSRDITSDEAEMLRASAIPPIGYIDELSADDMQAWRTCTRAGRKAGLSSEPRRIGS
jgi:hypothetical protein